MQDSREVIENKNKWRLLLGKNADQYLEYGSGTSNSSYQEMEEVLDFLYEKKQTDDIRQGDLSDSLPNAATWLSKVRTLFPKQTCEVLEHHAIDTFGMKDLLMDKEILEKLEPNMDLLKAVLQLKCYMKEDVLETAKKIIATVAEELKKKLEQEIERSFLGRIDRTTRSNIKSIRNFDVKRTIRENIKNYDRETQRLVIKNTYFNDRMRTRNPWKLMIAVDESGSMLDSVIYSSIMAGIFARVPMLETKLIAFDTKIVDLSDYVQDPVEILMGVQLGGGTDIGKALSYYEAMLENPQRSIIVCVTDLYEGGERDQLLTTCRNIIESGAKLIILTALDEQASCCYDRNLGQKLANMGANVGAMTPENLGDYIGKIIR